MAFEDLFESNEVKVGKYEGLITKAVATSSGVEMTISLNDPEKDAPVRGTHDVAPQAYAKDHSEVLKLNAERTEAARKEAEKLEKESAKEVSEKAQADKPSAVTRTNAPSKSVNK